MSTRKIRLSQKLTLRFRDISMPDRAGDVAELMNEETDQGSSDETFDSLPDLLPFIFQSQTKSTAPDLTYLVSDCSTYKLWESCATDVIPLASQNEEAEHWLLTGTHTSGADNSVRSDDIHKNLQSYDSDSITIATRIGVRENLRRVQAFSPQTSILYVEKDVSVREDLRSAHADVVSDAAIEIERQSDPLNIDGDTEGICADCYLIQEEDMTKESPFHESTVADETAGNSRLSSIEVPDGQEEHVDKHPEVNKWTRRRKSPYQASNYYSLDFPKEFRKQKRSTTRRERPSASINLVHKMKWLSDTYDHLERDQGAEVTASLPDKKEKTTSQTRKTRKTKRKSVSVSSVTTIFSEPPANQSVKHQPSGRRGRGKKNPLRSPASLNGEE